MQAIDTTVLADRLNRLVELALDTGEASSIEDAEKLFCGYKMSVVAGKDVGHSATQQATLLTIVNCARRSLLGGVEVEGIAGMPLLIPLFPYKTLEEAVARLGGKTVRATGRETPLMLVGDAVQNDPRQFAVRTTFEGWAGGIVPASAEGLRLVEQQEFIPAGVLSGALAVAETFQHLRGNNPAAGRRAVG